MTITRKLSGSNTQLKVLLKLFLLLSTRSIKLKKKGTECTCAEPAENCFCWNSSQVKSSQFISQLCKI